MKLDKLGWILAAAMAGGLLATGFDASAPKFATVDMEKVFSESDFTKSSSDKLQSAKDQKQSVLQFLAENQVMLPVDAQKYADLEAKSPMTDADKSEITRITADALAASNKQRDLATKSSPTAEDMKSLQDYSARMQQNSVFSGKLKDKFLNDLQDMTKKLHDDAMAKIKDAIKKVAEKQGYTIVFSEDSAPYAANNITQAALDDLVKK